MRKTTYNHKIYNKIAKIKGVGKIRLFKKCPSNPKEADAFINPNGHLYIFQDNRWKVVKTIEKLTKSIDRNEIKCNNAKYLGDFRSIG